MAEIIASTQEHLMIEDIQDNLVILKTGGAALVIQTTAVNFDLLSEKEQDSMIAAYSATLNSLSFPIQIVIRSKRMDVSVYIAMVNKTIEEQQNPLLKKQLESYKEFVKGLVQRGEVLDKRFYIIIPYQEVQLSGGFSPFDFLNSLLGRKTVRKVNKAVVLQKAQINLEPKKEHLLKQLDRIGVKGRRLTTAELTELYYEIYNPQQAQAEKVRGGKEQYLSPFVQPAVEGEQT